jgi:hypothetical protein
LTIMTNDNTMIGGGVVTASLTSVTTTTPATATLKRALLAPAQSNQDILLLEDAVLVHEEDKLMHDEEITSVESNEVDFDDADEDDDIGEAENDVDQTLLNVAIVNSLDKTKDEAETGDSFKDRLRKRRRRSGQDLARLEHFQTSGEGALARQPQPPTVLISSSLTPSANATTSVASQPKRNVRIKTEHLIPSRLLRPASSSARLRLPSISETVPNPLLNDIPSTADAISTMLPSKIKKEENNDSFPYPMSTFSDEPASISVETPIATSDGSRKVNFTADTSSYMSSHRLRGLSIDFDCTWAVHPDFLCHPALSRIFSKSCFRIRNSGARVSG